MVRRAAVVGTGISGLLAAAALRRLVDHVVLVERDELPSSPEPRRGVPQGEQLHNLLGRGQLHLEELLPGFRRDLEDLGCGVGCVAADTHVYELGVRMPERDLGLELLSSTRPNIDHAARTVLGRGPAVEVLDGATATGIDVQGARVTALHIVDRAGRATTIPADLVVDASGPARSAVRWTADHADTSPSMTSARSDQWYATSGVRPGPDALPTTRFLMVFPAGAGTRGALASPSGTGSWSVSVSGRSADPIPRSPGDLRAYARTLADPVIAELLDEASAVSRPRVFRKTMATWHRFDRLDVPIAGLLPIGDAIASLNPLFGQGVSVAAWQAAILAEVIAEIGQLDVDEVTHNYLGRAAEPVRWAWNLGAVVDELVEDQEDGGGGRVMGRRLADDIELHRLYVRMWHLLEPAGKLREAAASRPPVATRAGGSIE